MTPTPRLALITIMATVAYLGLAILGWGGFEGFFSHPALTALVIAVLVLTGVALFGGGNLRTGAFNLRSWTGGKVETACH